MTIIFTIISVHGEIDGKFVRTQPTILTLLRPFTTMTIAFTTIGVCVVRSMGSLNYWSMMKPPQKTIQIMGTYILLY